MLQTIIETTIERPRCARNVKSNPISRLTFVPANLGACIIGLMDRPGCLLRVNVSVTYDKV